MKEVISLPPESWQRTEIRYTCSRCGQPCGDSEVKRSSYQVLDATIELKTGQRIVMSIGEPGATVTIHDIKHVTIETQEGDQFSEQKLVTAQVVDCCAECYECYALPALVAAGFKPRHEDRSW